MGYDRLSRILRAVLLFLLIAGCASTGKQSLSPRSVPPQAYWHFVNGDLMELQGFSEAALVEYRKALQLDSLSVDVRLAMAEAYGKLGRWPEATVLMEETIEIDPSSVPLHMFLGDC
ncbi:tetratricopeptide repeat protein, partial [bacterium]|nr:tetratricopeptide repeat protein [bacterium]